MVPLLLLVDDELMLRRYLRLCEEEHVEKYVRLVFPTTGCEPNCLTTGRRVTLNLQ